MLKKILIADDEDTVREFAAYILKENGYEVIESFNGTRLVRDAKKNHPDIILTDILMPGLSGYAAVEQLRKIKKFTSIPVIFCSAVMKDKETFKTINPADPCCFLTKPFDKELLLKTVQEMLETSKT